MPLDERIKTFEQGVALGKLCKRALDEAELKVNMLLSKGDTEEGEASEEN
jgi:exodeoxyribonuclease VII small subunit